MTDAGALTTDERRALAAALDAIIPPSRDGRLPGAGALGLADALAAGLGPALRPGLAALAEVAAARGVETLATLEPAAKRAALEEAGQRAPGFLPALVAQTLVAYYQVGRVREALGIPARPPYPLGYTVEPSDFSRLEAVRARGPIYREP